MTPMQADNIEIAAWQDLMSAVTPAFAAAHGLRCERMGSALMIALPSVPTVLFNRAFGLGLDGPPNAQQLTKVLSFYAEHPHAAWAVQPTLSADGEAWASALLAAGLTPLPMRWAKTAQAAAPRPEQAHRHGAQRFCVREVLPDRAADYAHTIVHGMGLPAWFMDFCGALVGREGWRTYGAYDDQGTVFAAAASFQRGPLAWLGTATTLPHARNQGAQRALIARRISDAAANGAKWVFAETGEPQPDQPSPSFHNLTASGFEILGYRRSFSQVQRSLPPSGLAPGDAVAG